MNEYKRSVDAFMASEEGRKGSDPCTLGARESMRTYLENRLRSAFEAGWDARENSDAPPPKAKPG